VRELQAGLWHWQAPHPDWTPGEPWSQEVSSYAIDDGTQLLLFDPLAVPGQIVELAAEREPVVVLTAPWHERDTERLVERLQAPVFLPPPDTADDLVRKYGITPEQAAGGSPDAAWLLAGGGGEAHPYSAGERLPIGLEAFPAGSTTTSFCGTRLGGRSSPAMPSSTSVAVSRYHASGYATALRVSRSPKDCGRCSHCRSRPCSPRTAHRQTVLHSSARSPDAEGGSLTAPSPTDETCAPRSETAEVAQVPFEIVAEVVRFP
jgi:hypothetical protein